MSDTANLTQDIDIVSYGIGLQMGEQLKSQRIDGLDLELVKAGMNDLFAGNQPCVTQEQLHAAFQSIQSKLQARQEAEGREARAEGEKFLQDNAAKPGVITTASGLQYEVITEGSGEKPGAGSQVRTHYHGSFTDGKVFDSSVQRGQPAEFAVNGVISGWTEALQLMNVGSKWRLTVPSELAYGASGAPGAIPPHTVLVFEVELLAIL